MMKAHLLAILLSALPLLVGACQKSEAQGSAERDAAVAADAWLKLVDDAKYADSWEQAAAYFKQAVPSEQWQRQVGAVRQPLGKLVSRTPKSKKYTTALPGAPDGKYVVIEYDTVFEHKSSATETVTPMQDPDGSWRVSGYYIK
jgi:hypothetical protein